MPPVASLPVSENRKRPVLPARRWGFASTKTAASFAGPALSVVISGTFADGTFAGYRYEDVAVPRMHLDLSTPSGLRVGDPISTLNQVYASYQVDYLSSQDTDVFRLSDVDGLLLWGPVSSIEDSGRVEGIYAPDACSS